MAGYLLHKMLKTVLDSAKSSVKFINMTPKESNDE